VLAEHDVGAPACHLRGHGDGGAPAGERDELRLGGVVLGIEHHVRHVEPGQEGGQVL